MQTLKLDDLCKAVAGVGIHLEPAQTGDRDANLYAWVTGHDEVVYIGKAETAKRLSDERSWVDKEFDPLRINVAFVAIMRRQHATPRAFVYRGDLNRDVALQALTGWHETGGIPALRTYLQQASAWTVADIERVLIRAAVLAGYPLANSYGAGLWNNYCGQLHDTLAGVAVVNDPVLSFDAELRGELVDAIEMTPALPATTA